jgi:hypothetical protein
MDNFDKVMKIVNGSNMESCCPFSKEESAGRISKLALA